MSRCWYCNEELTTANYCDEHIGICTKCYNSMFKVGNDFVKGLTDKISDLEAKLAEKQSKIQELNDMYEDLLIAKGTENELMQVSADCDFFAKENRKLKQQVVDKDKQIKQLKLDLGMFKSVNEFVNSYGIQKAREVLLQTEKTKMQDKILFCIEQLEKVYRILTTEDVWRAMQTIWWLRPDGCYELRQIIDNQIKELKKEIK